jgi:FAD dependent oxidoreductase
MGAILSTVRFAYHTVKDLINEYDVLSKRISPSPGIPQLNASIPYWTIPLSPIARQGYDAPLPLDADIVIIGSGITGTSVAKALLEQDRGTEPLKIVMLDARDACSGATGRCVFIQYQVDHWNLSYTLQKWRPCLTKRLQRILRSEEGPWRDTCTRDPPIPSGTYLKSYRRRRRGKSVECISGARCRRL